MRRVTAIWLLSFSSLLTHAQDGVTPTTIVIGQSASLTGPAAEYGQQFREGALAYFESVNRRGGVNGRKIVLKSLDDAGNTQKGAANAKQLIEQDKVFVLFGYTGRNTSEAAMPVFKTAGVPFFGAASGADSLHGEFNKYIINVRAGYSPEIERLVQHFVALGQRKIGLLHLKDDTKKLNLRLTEAALAKQGLKVHSEIQVDRAGGDIAQGVDYFLKQDPEAIICVAPAKTLAAFIKGYKQGGGTGTVAALSFAGKQVIDELGKDAVGVIMAQVVPLPTRKMIPIVAEFQRELAKVAPKSEPTFNNLEGYISAKVLVEGLKRAGKNPSREGVIAAIQSIDDWDLGGMTVRYSPRNHNGSKFVDITIVNKSGRFVN